MDEFLESSSVQITDVIEEGDHNLFNDKKWEWGFLRKKCRNLELEQFYEAYMQRLRVSYLSVFMVIQSLIIFVHVILLFTTTIIPDTMYMDIGIYIVSTVIVWLILAVNFREKVIKRYPSLMYFTSWLAVVVMVLADVSVPLYHALTTEDNLRPTYVSFILYAIYIFLPLPDNIQALVLGITASTCYMITFAFITYRKVNNNRRTTDMSKLMTEGIFMVCVSLLGLYFRMMKEIAIRTTFLDRRQCVEENLLLRYARDQEKNLLLSIIPARIANKIEQDVKVRIEHLKLQNQVRYTSQDETRKLFIEPHDDVTILYADVVNYTYLTTTLDVKTLVETIHDLFVKFDLASEEHNVLRIKFLGDCYYCVSGVPVPNEYHAKCCVNLGLRMIQDIRDVRVKRRLNIDMRIGVHSGNIFSGVIGACKWQFDIWSRDVDIANRLEQTGQAGRVHVSEETLKLLDGEYLYEEGPLKARQDEVLRKYHIKTFLIKPVKTLPVVESGRRSGSGVRRQLERQVIKQGNSTNFMQNTIVQYNQIRTQAKLEMSRELDKMPTGRIQISNVCFGRSKRLTKDEMEGQSFRSNISSMCLFFKDWRWEFLFMREPDVMLKYSILFAMFIFFGIMSMQAINNRQSKPFWNLNFVDISLLLIFLFVTWYKKIWIMYIGETETSRPSNKYSAFFFNLSERVEKSVLMRIFIYLTIVTMHCLCTLLQLQECDRLQIENDEINIQLFDNGNRDNFCFNTWAITECLVLTICMSFLFTRIPFVMKLVVGLIIICVYVVIVLFEFDIIYEKSLGTNVGLFPEYSHLLVLLFTLGIYHLMDRQTEFISKVDFNWKRQLQKKQDDAKFTNETIKILINNILPTHVADIYMTKIMKNELYFEEYENVAIMFATIRNYDTEQVGLRVLNEIICDFDKVLNFYKTPLKVEKIKVAGWTYMAACGLDVSRSENVTNQISFRNSSLLPTGRRSQYHAWSRASTLPKKQQHTAFSRNAPADQYAGQYDTRKSRKISSPQQSNVIYVMVQFALDLMRTLHSFNMENLQNEDGRDRGMLRIGISNGEVMAGVVGSYKPHYDIWGNPVNMASRMDSTGLPGHIQVTEETAQILQTFGLQCEFRGMTYVKGRNEIPTYFVQIDENLNFVTSGMPEQREENP